MILNDDIPEGDEKFQLILTNPSPGLELGEHTAGNGSFPVQYPFASCWSANMGSVRSNWFS